MTKLISAAQVLSLQTETQGQIENRHADFEKKEARMPPKLTQTRIQKPKKLWDDFSKKDQALRNCHNIDHNHKWFLKDTQETFDDVHDSCIQFLQTLSLATTKVQTSATFFENHPPVITQVQATANLFKLLPPVTILVQAPAIKTSHPNNSEFRLWL